MKFLNTFKKVEKNKSIKLLDKFANLNGVIIKVWVAYMDLSSWGAKPLI